MTLEEYRDIITLKFQNICESFAEADKAEGDDARQTVISIVHQAFEIGKKARPSQQFEVMTKKIDDLLGEKLGDFMHKNEEEAQ